MSYYTDVADWHRKFGVPVADHPAALSPDRLALRLALMREERRELDEALEAGDLPGAAKEAADEIVTVLGTMAEAGIPFDAVWAEVMASIHSKAEPDGTVHKRADGKILKGSQYREADIAAVLAGTKPRPGIRPAEYWEAWCAGDGAGEHQIEFGDYTGWSDRADAESGVDDGEHVLLRDGRVFCWAHIPAGVCPDSADNRHEPTGDHPDECAHCGKVGLAAATPQAVTA